MTKFTFVLSILGLSALAGCQTLGQPTAGPADSPTTKPAKVARSGSGTPQLPDQTLLVLDDIKSTTVIFKGVRNIDADDLTVIIRAKGKKLNDPDNISIVAERLEVLDHGRMIAAVFPSLALWEFTPKKIDLYLGSTEGEPWRTFDAEKMVYRTKQPETAAATPPAQQQAYEVVISSSTIVVDNSGKGSLRIDFRRLDDVSKMHIGIQGAQVEGIKSDPTTLLANQNGEWTVQSSGTVLFELGNLSPLADVVISGRDTKGVSYAPVRFHVVQGK